MPEFVNQSFELPGGSAAAVTSGNSEPITLADEQTLLVAVDGGPTQSALMEIGSRGTVLSGATQTYALVDGQTLDVEVDGGVTQTATFNTADFVAISAATASEVAAVILTDVTGVFVVVESGAVRITTATKGAAGSVEVTGGTANPTLSFPAGLNSGTDFFVDITAATAAEVAAQINSLTSGMTASDSGGAVLIVSDTLGAGSSIRIGGGAANIGLDFDLDLHVGVTAAGVAQGWLLAITAVAFEIATFDTTFPESFEDFEEEWGLKVPGLTPSNSTLANFNLVTGPDLFESFEVEWGNGPGSLSGGEAAVFVDTAAPTGFEAFEDFETFATGSPFPTPTFFTALFDIPSEPFEDFEEGWGQTSAPAFSAAVFGPGAGPAETFTPFTAVQEVVTVNALESGELYVVVINSENAVVTGSGSTANIATLLAAAINNLSQDVTATPVGSTVEVEHNNAGDPFVLNVIGPPSNPAALTFQIPNPTIQWTGGSLFCL